MWLAALHLSIRADGCSRSSLVRCCILHGICAFERPCGCYQWLLEDGGDAWKIVVYLAFQVHTCIHVAQHRCIPQRSHMTAMPIISIGHMMEVKVGAVTVALASKAAQVSQHASEEVS